MPNRSYRADIDGLRAVAVLSVLFFHLDIDLVSGGYVGVDVFFVISGFLITRIIKSEIDGGVFSIWRFYERRIRRIFPALFVMMAVVGVVAWFVLLPIDFKNFGQSLAAATLFASNLLFIFEAGYFDGPAEFKPLLHTWSLAVEEQYYLVFPLLMVLLSWVAPQRLVVLIVVLALASFLWALVGTQNYPVTTFFLSPPRFWELLIGALLALNILPRWRDSIAVPLSWVGLAAIVAAAIAFDRNTMFPGWAALLPCLGAALLIHCGNSSPHPQSANRLLAQRPMVAVGLVSYSLYLWHWPVIVFAKYTLVRDLGPVDQIMLAAASGAMAYLSWRLIEQPYRDKQIAAGRAPLFRQAAAVMAVAVAGGVVISELRGVPSRFSPEIVAHDRDKLPVGYRRACNQPKYEQTGICVRGKDIEEPSFMLLGDSHARSISPAVFTAAEALGRAGIQLTVPGYRPFLDYAHHRFERIDRKIDRRLQRIMADYPSISTVIIIAHWNQAIEFGYTDLATGQTYHEEIIDLGLLPLIDAYPERHFVIIRDFPISADFGASRYARALAFDREPVLGISRAHHEEANRAYVDRLEELRDRPNVTLTHLDDVYCDARFCASVENGRSLYRDNNHVSLLGAMKAQGFFSELLQNLPD